MNYSRAFGWFLFAIFILIVLAAIISAVIILTSNPIIPHTMCLPGWAAPDKERYEACAPCGRNRYSPQGIFCLDCPSHTYTCTDTANLIDMCGNCMNFTFDTSTNSSICSSCG